MGATRFARRVNVSRLLPSIVGANQSVGRIGADPSAVAPYGEGGRRNTPFADHEEGGLQPGLPTAVIARLDRATSIPEAAVIEP
jgi:hypothetical protein